MKTCQKCKTKNPEGNNICSNCGTVLRPPEVRDGKNGEDLSALLAKLKGLQVELDGKDGELDGLRQALNSKNEELNGVQLQLTAANKELEDLRTKMQTTEAEAGKQDSPDPSNPQLDPKSDFKNAATDDEPVKTQEGHHSILDGLREEAEKIGDKLHIGTAHAAEALAIEAYPLKKPEFHVEMSAGQTSLDLATTAFRIRATLERTADAIELLVHGGATVNVRMSDKQKWTRLTGGVRRAAADGLILYDPTAAMNARLGSGHEQ